MNWAEAFAIVGGSWAAAFGVPRLIKVLVSGDY